MYKRQADLQPGPRWTLNAGIRYDYFHNRYLNRLDSTDRRASAGLVSPKASLYFTVNPKLRLALRLGRGFHANDTRVVVRPSGTEPKLKCYLEVVEPVAAEADEAALGQARRRAAERLTRVTEDLRQVLGQS